MSTKIIFETHSLTIDNENGIATGWLPGALSDRGRVLAVELGERRRRDAIAVVFTSDLGRAVETASIAFEGSGIPVLHDWRLRECDYGDWNGATANQVQVNRRLYLDEPYPAGESWRAAVARTSAFLDDLSPRWDDARVLVIGHVATRWTFDHVLLGVPLEQLVDSEFAWRDGWEYSLRP